MLRAVVEDKNLKDLVPTFKEDASKANETYIKKS